MKKILGCIVVLVMATLCSCSNPDYVPPDQYAKNQNKTIMECIEAKDSERLKSILCPFMQNKEDIDEKIEKLFQFIDGNIISYDEPKGSVTLKESTPQGIILETLDGWTRNIVTDTGKKYELKFGSHYINKEHEDYVGVAMIVINEVDGYTAQNNATYKDSYGIYLNSYLNEDEYVYN